MDDSEYFRFLYNANLCAYNEKIPHVELRADKKDFILVVQTDQWLSFRYSKQTHRIVRDDRVRILNLSEYKAYRMKDSEWQKIIDASE